MSDILHFVVRWLYIQSCTVLLAPVAFLILIHAVGICCNVVGNNGCVVLFTMLMVLIVGISSHLGEMSKLRSPLLLPLHAGQKLPTEVVSEERLLQIFSFYCESQVWLSQIVSFVEIISNL